MKIDLDDLDRKARAATPGRWLSDASEADDGEAWSDEPYKLVAKTGRDPVAGNARHIAANSPPVTLALIARIRELEVLAKELADVYDGEGYPKEAVRVLDILDKGTTIP